MKIIIGYPEMMIFAAICFLFLNHFNKKIHVPHRPLVGTILSLFFNFHRVQLHDWLTELLSKAHGTFVFRGPWFTNVNILFTSDPSNMRHIFNTNFSNYPKGPEFNEVFDALGDGIFNADSDSWKAQRKLAHQFINHHKFQKFLVQTSCSKVEKGLIPVLEHVVEENLVVDMQDVFKRLMFDISFILLVGSDPGCLGIEFSHSPCVDALDDAEEALLYRHFTPTILWKLQRWLRIGKEKKLSNAVQCFDQLISLSVAAKRKKIKDEEAKEKGVDLLTSYMEEDEVFGSKSDKFLRDTMVTFIAAGTSTVSATLTWFFWLVSQNPEVEGKIVEEIKSKAISFSFSTQGKKVKMFNMEDLKGLVYLYGALCEALRLFPSVPFNHKRPVKPDILPSGHRVDSKTRIMPLMYSVGRMEYVWGKDCLEFKPERWISSDGGIQSVSSSKFMAFSSGPRTCLGKEITFTQMRVVAATILYNYHVEVVDSHSISLKNSVVLHMKHGLKAKIKTRF